MKSWKRKLAGSALLTMALAALPLEASAYGPTGLGPNLHRRFVVRQARRRASRGLPVRRHYGVWVAGGYPVYLFRR